MTDINNSLSHNELQQAEQIIRTHIKAHEQHAENIKSVRKELKKRLKQEREDVITGQQDALCELDNLAKEVNIAVQAKRALKAELKATKLTAENIKKTVGRPCKFATQEEREEHGRNYRKEYYKNKNAATVHCDTCDEDIKSGSLRGHENSKRHLKKLLEDKKDE